MFGIQSPSARQLRFLIRGTEVKLRELRERMPEAWAHRVHHKLVDNVRKDRFNLPSNNPRYLRWKQAHGRSSKVLIATGEYIKSIEVRRIGKNWWVGIPQGLMHTNSDLLMSDLAKILEFGSPAKGIPSRPLWALTRAAQEKEYQAWAKKFAQKLFSEMAGINVGGGRGGRRWLRVEKRA